MGVTGKTVYPKVTEAQRDCILCGLCVAVCEQVIGASAIAFADRGVNRAVAAPFREASETCVGCGACAAVCPVGTIKLRWHADAVEVSPFKSRVPLRRCAECGVEIGGETFAAQVQAKAGAVAEGMRLCARCKRQAVARHLLKVAQRPDGGGD
jgi:ferredoxin